MTTQPLVVIPCGGRKLAHAAPAAELYTGSYFRAALAAALTPAPAAYRAAGAGLCPKETP